MTTTVKRERKVKDPKEAKAAKVPRERKPRVSKAIATEAKATAKSTNGSGLEPKDFKVGSTVKYIGTRNPDLRGKTAEVVGFLAGTGIKLKWKDGSVSGATANALEIITKG